MKALIIDDDKNKTTDIIEAIQDFFLEIDTAETRNDGLRKMFVDSIKYDLVILDMRFPVTQGSSIEKECGISVLKEMVRRGSTIPVVFCSSGPVVDWHKYDPNGIVESFILYDSATSIRARFEGLFIRLFPKKERIEALIKKIKDDCQKEHAGLISNLNFALKYYNANADDKSLKLVTYACRNMIILDSLENLINTNAVFEPVQTSDNAFKEAGDLLINYLQSLDNVAKTVVDINHIITGERDFSQHMIIKRMSDFYNKKEKGEL